MFSFSVENVPLMHRTFNDREQQMRNMKAARYRLRWGNDNKLETVYSPHSHTYTTHTIYTHKPTHARTTHSHRLQSSIFMGALSENS